MTGVELRALNTDDTDAGILPQLKSGYINTELSDTGGGEVTYPSSGLNASLLDHDRVIRVLIDGVEPRNARWVCEDKKPSDNPASDDSVSTTWNGRSLVGMLEKVPVFPVNWPNPTPGTYPFTAASPGTVIQLLMTAARARNSRWAKRIKTDTFSGSLDSAGKPWVQTITQEFSAGTNYLQVLQLLYDRGFIEFEMNQSQLLVYNPGTVYRDWTLADWKSRWWNRSSTTFDTVDETVDPALETHARSLDITNQDVAGTTNYNYSIHEANVKVTGGSYTLALTFKDALRITIDGTKVYEKWTSGAQTTVDQAATLAAGIHYVRMEHFNTTGGERLRVQIRGGEFGGSNVALNADDTNIVLRRGLNLSDINRAASSRDRYDVALVGGDEGTFAATTAPGGDVDEVFIQQGGVTDSGTLQAIGTLNIRSQKNVKSEISATTSMAAIGTLKPLIDFRAGDHIFVDDSSQATRQRTLQINVRFEQSSVVQASMTLNDKFQDMDVLVKRRLDWIAGGLEGTGPNPTPTPSTDNTVPNPPTSPTISSIAYQSADGTALAQVTLAWTPPTTNTDSTPITDIASYEIQYALFLNGAWQDWQSTGGAPSDATFSSFSALPTSTSVRARIRTVDNTNNRSAWSTTATGTTAADNVPPNKPSTPTLTAGIATVSIEWDGLDTTSGPMPADLAYVEIHASASAAFTPTTATRIGRMPGAGRFVYVPPDYTNLYYKLVAADRSGYRSTPSDPAGPAAPRQIISQDVLDNAITEAKIASGAITAAKTALAAIDPASGSLTINSVATNNLQAGAVTALKIAAGSISTDKLTVEAMAENLIINGGFEFTPPGGSTDPVGQWDIETIWGISANQIFLFTTSDYTQIANPIQGWYGNLATTSGGFGVFANASSAGWPQIPGDGVFSGFEYQAFEVTQAWLDSNTAKNRTTVTSVSDASVGGAKAIEIVTLATGTGNWAVFLAPTSTTYNATVVAGATYRLEMWIWNSSTSASFQLDVRYKSTTGADTLMTSITVPSRGPTPWVLWTRDIVIPASPAETAGRFELRFAASGVTCRIDQLRITRLDGSGGYVAPKKPLTGNSFWRMAWTAASVAGGPAVRIQSGGGYNNAITTATWPDSYIGEPHRFSLYARSNDSTAVTRNLVTNPRPAPSLAGWQLHSGGAAATLLPNYDATDGDKARATATGSGALGVDGPPATVSASTQYTASARVRHSATATAAVVIDWYNGATYLSSSETSTSLTANTWQRLAVTATSPATANGARIRAESRSATAGRVLDVQKEQIVAGASDPTYIDGDQTNCGWDQAPDASTSVRGTTPTSYAMQLKVYWFNVALAVISTELGPTANLVPAWHRFEMTATPPANAITALLSLERTVANSVVNQSVEIDGVNVTTGDTHFDYTTLVTELTRTGDPTASADISDTIAYVGSGQRAGLVTIPDMHYARVLSPPTEVAENDLFQMEAWAREPSPSSATRHSPTVLYCETAPSSTGPWTRVQSGAGQVLQDRFSLTEGGETTPPGTKFARVVLEIGPENWEHSAREIYVDDFTIRRSGGKAFIRDASIVSAKIVDLTVAKLTGGVMTADVIVGGSFRTGSVGARVGFDINGFYAYNSAEVRTFFVDALDGAAELIGNVQVGLPPDPYITMDAFILPSIDFFPDGTQYPEFRIVGGTVTDPVGNTSASIQMRSYDSTGSIGGGQINLSGTGAKFSYEDATVEAFYFIDWNGVVYMKGGLGLNQTWGGRPTFYFGSASVGSSVGVTISYAATMATIPMPIPVFVPTDGSVVTTSAKTSTSTNFQVGWSATKAGKCYYFNPRAAGGL